MSAAAETKAPAEAKVTVKSSVFACFCGKTADKISVGRIAKCGHTFCEQCLIDRLDKQVVICPSDHTALNLSQFGVAGFPRDYAKLPADFFAPVLPSAAATGGSGAAAATASPTAAAGSAGAARRSGSCSMCVGLGGEQAEHDAQYYCKVCKLMLCQRGLSMHHLIAGSREHGVLTLSQLEALDAAQAASDQCPEHHKLVSCWNSKAARFLCAECVAGGSFDAAATVSLSDSIEGTLGSIAALSADVGTAVDLLASAESALVAAETTLDGNLANALQASRASFASLREAVDATEKRMQAMVSAAAAQRKAALKERATVLRGVEASILQAFVRAGVKLPEGKDGGDTSEGTAAAAAAAPDAAAKPDASSSASSSAPSAASAVSSTAAPGAHRRALETKLSELQSLTPSAFPPTAQQLKGIEADLRALVNMTTAADGLARLPSSALPPLASLDAKAVLTAINELVPSSYLSLTERHRTKGHPASVFTVSASPDGALLASGGSGTTQSLFVWDAVTGKEVAAPRGHANTVLSLAFSPSGQHLATGSADKTVLVWAVGNWSRDAALELKCADYVDQISWSPDGSKIAVCQRNKTEVNVYEFPSRAELYRLKGFRRTAVTTAWSRDGKYVLATSTDGVGRVFDAATGKFLCELRNSPQYARRACWMPDSARLVIGSDDRMLRLWELTQRGSDVVPKLTATLGVSDASNEFINGIAAHPHAPYIVVGLARSADVVVVNTDTFTVQTRQRVVLASSTKFSEHTGKDVAFSADGRSLHVGVETATVTYDFEE